MEHLLAIITEGEIVWPLILILIAVLGGAVSWKTLRQKDPEPQKEFPNPVRVKKQEEFVTWQDFRDFKDTTTRQIERLGGDIKEGFQNLDHERRVSIGTLHTQLKNAEVKLATVEAETHSTQRTVDRLETKLDNLVDRVADKVQEILKGHRKP